MLEFLLALLTTVTVGALLVPLLRTSARRTERLDSALQIYRDQLAEIERARADGTTPETEAAAARIEVERRILAAANAADAATPKDSSALHRFLPPALALLIPLLALGVYLNVGRPGLPAAPFGTRPAADHPNPNEQMTPERLLAEARARLAQQPDDPDALSALGEALVLEADGSVTPEAIEAFNKALAQRPDDPRAHYYLGLHEAQSGDSKAAVARWQALEARSPPEAPWLPMLRAEIARVSRAAGMPAPQAQTGMPTPTRDQVEAMQSLNPEQRQQAIRSMVEGLDLRLKENPGDRAGWLRLANAWRVLGENAKAADAYAKADALGPLDTKTLTDWAEAHVRQIAPGAPPPPEAVAVLERLEKAEPRNALALFYLGAASFAAGDKPAALRRWKTLLQLLPADAPIRGLLEERIKAAE
ncbi:MAG: c-type cytochrome biogenesis protein CcmI [Reyranella sp.]|uniref:c-type cytochrome biogenesis protein CcmI n=1 Tax=Reyranella sp. TaxID=1929291 RepID=UPI0011FAE498|nr:c-type cytochrome biogenesis protein CcmI [Reyranella sp.]TAJ35658.1 MAG: c-type cytochrome biogenesis protein CcmI [Reyranella sp.]